MNYELDMTPGDMAEVMAEYEYENALMTEILERAYRSIKRDWLALAASNPKAVQDAYFQLMRIEP